MAAHLVRRNARSVPWVGEKALVLTREQDPIGHDIGPRASKSSFPPEEPDSRILRGYCGAKWFGDLGPFHIKSLAHVKKEELSEDEQRKSKLPGYNAEDNPILGRSRSRKGKVLRHQGQSPRASQRKSQAQGASHKSMVEKQFQERLSPPY